MSMLPSWVVRTIGYALAVLLIMAAIWVVADILNTVTLVSFSITAALLFSALLEPLARLLRHRARLPRWAAALTTLLVFLAAVFGTLYWIARRVIGQLDGLRQSFTDAVNRLRDWLVGPPLSLPQSRVDQLEDRVVQAVNAALPSAVAGATLLLQLLAGAALVVFLLFFLLKNGDLMWRWLLSWLPEKHHLSTDQAGFRAWETLTAYVRGTVVVALVDALGIGLALMLVGNPLTASLTFLVFLGAFVPIVGATASGAVAVAVTLVSVGFGQAVIILVAVIAVQQLEGNLLQPLIMGQALHLSPVAIVIAVTLGALLGGIIGAIVAVPILAVAYRVASYYRGREPATPSDRSASATHA